MQNQPNNLSLNLLKQKDSSKVSFNLENNKL